MKQDVRVILHNIRSSHNVGAILRTADGAGVMHVYITGYTPAPVDRFGRANKEIAKTALGAEKSIQWEQRKLLSMLVKILKREGVAIIGVEQSKKSIALSKLKKFPKVAYIFGNEVEGLAARDLSQCDKVVELPMVGKKESLNVSAAAAIVLYHSLI